MLKFVVFIAGEDDQDSMAPDITDTVELSRRLLEILSKSDPAECEEELKKLKQELHARSKYMTHAWISQGKDGPVETLKITGVLRESCI